MPAGISDNNEKQFPSENQFIDIDGVILWIGKAPAFPAIPSVYTSGLTFLLERTTSAWTFQSWEIPHSGSWCIDPANQRTILLHFPQDWRQKLLPLLAMQTKSAPIVLQSPAAIDFLINAIWSDSNQQGLCYQWRRQARFLDLLHLIFSSENDGAVSNSTASDAGIPQAQKLEKAREIVRQQRVSPPSLAELALLCGLNEFSLKAGFRQRFGHSVYREVAKARMEKAVQLLADTGLSIAEIAMETGYAQPQHFSAAFRREMKMSPREWRWHYVASGPYPGSSKL